MPRTRTSRAKGPADSKRREQLEKNRISARVYRQRKRERQNELETINNGLEKENAALKARVNFLETALAQQQADGGADETAHEQLLKQQLLAEDKRVELQFKNSATVRALTASEQAHSTAAAAEAAPRPRRTRRATASVKHSITVGAPEAFAPSSTRVTSPRAAEAGPDTGARRSHPYGPGDFRTDAFADLERVQVTEDESLLQALAKVEEALMPRPSARLILYIAEEISTLRAARRRATASSSADAAAASSAMPPPPSPAAAAGATAAAPVGIGGGGGGVAVSRARLQEGACQPAARDFAPPAPSVDYAAPTAARLRARFGTTALEQLGQVAAAVLATDAAMRDMQSEPGAPPRPAPPAHPHALAAGAPATPPPGPTPPGSAQPRAVAHPASTPGWRTSLRAGAGADGGSPPDAVPAAKRSRGVPGPARAALVAGPPSAGSTPTSATHTPQEAAPPAHAPAAAPTAAAAAAAGTGAGAGAGAGAMAVAGAGDGWVLPTAPRDAPGRLAWVERGRSASVSAMLSQRLRLTPDQQRLILEKSGELRTLEGVYLRAMVALRGARREIVNAIRLQARARDEMVGMLRAFQLTELMGWFEENAAFVEALRSRWQTKVAEVTGQRPGATGVWWPGNGSDGTTRPSAPTTDPAHPPAACAASASDATAEAHGTPGADATDGRHVDAELEGLLRSDGARVAQRMDAAAEPRRGSAAGPAQ